MYAIYGNMDPINIPPMLAYILYMDIHGSYGIATVSYSNYVIDCSDFRLGSDSVAANFQNQPSLINCIFEI